MKVYHKVGSLIFVLDCAVFLELFKIIHDICKLSKLVTMVTDASVVCVCRLHKGVLVQHLLPQQ